MTPQFHRLIFKINIVFLLSYLAASGELSYDNSNIVLLAQESYATSLLPVAQKLNTIFEIANPPAYVTLVNSLQATQTLSFQNAFQNSTASFINSTFVAFIDAAFSFSYGTYDMASQKVTFNSVTLTNQSADSICSSMTSLREYIIIVCEEYDQSQSKQIQTLYSFDTNAAKFETKTQDLPYQGLKEKLDATVLASKTSIGPLVITYYNTTSLQDKTSWIYVTNLQSGQGSFVNLTELGLINRIEMSFQEIYLITDQGSVYSGQYDETTTLGNFKWICTTEDNIIQTSLNHQGLAVMAKTKLYYLQDGVLSIIFQIPLGFSPLFCSLDNKFAYVVVFDTLDSATYALVYALNGSNNPNYFITRKIPFTTQVLEVSRPETTGNFILLSEGQICALQVREPKLVLTQVTESAVFNITTNSNPQDFVTINITVISDPTQAFQLNQTMPPISGINSPAIQVLNTFIGPSIGLLEPDHKTFSQSVYGPCPLKNLSIPTDSSFLSIRIVKTSESLINNQTATNVSFVQGSTITYTSFILDNLYADQFSSSVNKLLNQTKYDLAANPSKCILGNGKSYDICLVNQLLVHIDPIQGVIFKSTQQCQDIYLWSRSNGDVSLCINNEQILIYNKTGQSVCNLTPAQINIPSFSSLRVTSNNQDLLVIAYEKGISGLNLLRSQPPKLAFSISVNLNTDAFLQLASNKIILAQFNDNTIGEWDISDLENPYFIKNYPLFSFKLDSTIQPFYQVKPNHLGFHAYDQNQVPYLLTFQPGNLANSVLIYATKLETSSKITTSAFDEIFKYNVFFSLDSEKANYLYLAESPIIPLPTNESDETCSSLYCTESSLLQITSNINLQQVAPFNITYTTIYAEKSISPIDLSSLGEPTIRSDIPLVGLPRDVSGGTPLEYNLTNLTLKVSGKIENVLYFKTPLDLFQTLSTSVSSDPLTANSQLRLFGEDKTLYILDEVGLFFLDTSKNPLRLTSIKLSSLPPNVTLIDGDYDYYSGSVVLSYRASDAWGIYVHPDGLNYKYQNPISKVKITHNFIFVLAQGGGVDLAYILNKDFSFSGTIKSDVFPNIIIPQDLNVEKVADSLYSLLLADGTDSVYNLIFNQTDFKIQPQKIEKITQFVAADLPPNDLQIVGIQTTKNDQNSIVNYVLFVENFHSYQIQLKYQTDKSVTVNVILTCFVQMPGHKSTGNAIMTDSFFFDLKEKLGIYYLYNYPLNSTYSDADDYDYIQPIQRRKIADSLNANKLQVYASDGTTTTAFVGVRSQNGINIPHLPEPSLRNHNSSSSSSKQHIRKIRQLQGDPQDVNSQIQILVYNATYTLEVGFNPDLWSTDLANVEADKVYLGIANDISTGNLEINLDKPLNLLNSTYFIIFTIIFTLLFCLTCAWFFRRAYKKRKVSLDRDSISYHGVEDDLIQKEKPKRKSTKQQNI